MPVLSTRNSTLPALISLTAFAMSAVTVPVFGFGIRPRGTEHFSELAHGAHHVGRGDDGVEVHEAALNLVHHLFAADDVGAGFLRLFLLLAARDGEHALGFSEAMRQDDRAAHHLVGVFRIDPEPQRHVDGFVELDVLRLLHERDRVFDRVASDRRRSAREQRRISFRVFASVKPPWSWRAPPRLPSHVFCYPITSKPIERAVPATV